MIIEKKRYVNEKRIIKKAGVLVQHAKAPKNPLKRIKRGFFFFTAITETNRFKVIGRSMNISLDEVNPWIEGEVLNMAYTKATHNAIRFDEK